MNALCCICSFVFATALVGALGGPLIAALRRFSLRQRVYEDAPATHAIKSGTPTMGGVLFALVLVLCALGSFMLRPGAAWTQPALELIGLSLGCAAIGFFDDLLSVMRGRNRGLRGRVKFALTAFVGAAFLLALSLNPADQRPDPALFLVGTSAVHVPPWLWYTLGIAAIVSTTHAVNLSDGLDGLAAGTIIPPLLVFAWVAARGPQGTALGSIDAATAGAACGFLFYNRHPARVFMGDTGSLLLGGMLAGSAIVLDQQLLLLLVGGVFVAEAASVILQVTAFKGTGRRIFRMSPLHHHFELGGLSEPTVTRRFWAASAVLSFAGVVLTR